jgi:hypothetical protein
METKNEFIEPLLKKAADYGKTSFKIVHLKIVEKSAVLTAAIFFRLLLIAVIFFFLIAVNVALSLWLGQLMGQNYWGFLLTGLLYAVIAVTLLFLQPFLKARISNFIIIQLLK